MLRAFLIATLVLPYTAVAAAIGLFHAAVTGSDVLLFRLGHAGVRLTLLLAGTRIALEGRENLGDARNTVVISNHVSHLDGPVLFEALGTDLRAVGKKEVFSWPFLGPVLRRAGFVAVNRRDRIQSGQALSRAAASLRAGTCFPVFPEGTRSRTGELGAFKKGGFVIGIEAGSRILPVVVHGGRELMPAGGFRTRGGAVGGGGLGPLPSRGYSFAERARVPAQAEARHAA